MRAAVGSLVRRQLASTSSVSCLDNVAVAHCRRSSSSSSSSSSSHLPLLRFTNAVNNNWGAASWHYQTRAVHATVASPQRTTDGAVAAADEDVVDPKRRRRFCVVGSGPAGMYAADRLLAHYGQGAAVDMIERLPTPFGLVRSGVAPDHAGTKSVTNRFDGILADPRVSFLGNVALGRDVHMEDLAPRYHATVLAYGAEGDKRLNVPGEDELEGVCSAREFVGWYNGDPSCVESLNDVMRRSLARTDGDTAVVFGLGNVAVDCARVLLKRPEHLAETDVCEHALRALRESTVRRVVMIGRRGVAQGAFSPKELRELLGLPGVKVTVDPEELRLEAEDEADLADRRPRRRAYEAIAKALAAPPAGSRRDADDTKGGGGGRELVLKFLRSPVEFLPAAAADGDDGEVEPPRIVGAVRLSVNILEGPSGSRRAVSTDARETISGTTLVLRSVGYRALPLPAPPSSSPSPPSHAASSLPSSPAAAAASYPAAVPFDATRGVVPNVFGRVVVVVEEEEEHDGEEEEECVPGTLRANIQEEEEEQVERRRRRRQQIPGLYVCGWLKRGPTGIIGTNLNCAEETVGAIVEDDGNGKLPEPKRRRRPKEEEGEGGEEGGSASDGNGDDDDDGLLDLSSLLRARGVRVVDREGWVRIDTAEREAGRAAGKPREKFVDVQDMLRVAAAGGGL